MKRYLSSFLAIGILCLMPACKFSPGGSSTDTTPPAAVTTTNQIEANVSQVVNNLPPVFTNELAKLGAKYPKQTEAVAKAIMDGSTFLKHLPTPAELDTLFFWTTFTPYSAEAGEVKNLYATYYATLPGGSATLAGIALVLDKAAKITSPALVAFYEGCFGDSRTLRVAYLIKR